MPKNFKLTISYDGKAYRGWQKTAMGPSIEQALEDVLLQILQEQVVLQAASRTDAGVHAEGQIVNFISSHPAIETKRLKFSLNCLLPKDIAVLHVEEVDLAFHPTLDCIGKEYHYHICYGAAQLPRHRFYSWHYPHPLDLVKMREAIPILLGKKDFSAFCNDRRNLEVRDYIRIVHRMEIETLFGEKLCFKIFGKNFLYKMVRNIVGTLVYVGRGKIAVDDLEKILASCDRSQAGVTAPAHGLSLHRVDYGIPQVRK